MPVELGCCVGVHDPPFLICWSVNRRMRTVLKSGGYPFRPGRHFQYGPIGLNLTNAFQLSTGCAFPALSSASMNEGSSEGVGQAKAERSVIVALLECLIVAVESAISRQSARCRRRSNSARLSAL